MDIVLDPELVEPEEPYSKFLRSAHWLDCQHSLPVKDTTECEAEIYRVARQDAASIPMHCNGSAIQ